MAAVPLHYVAHGNFTTGVGALIDKDKGMIDTSSFAHHPKGFEHGFFGFLIGNQFFYRLRNTFQQTVAQHQLRHGLFLRSNIDYDPLQGDLGRIRFINGQTLFVHPLALSVKIANPVFNFVGALAQHRLAYGFPYLVHILRIDKRHDTLPLCNEGIDTQTYQLFHPTAHKEHGASGIVVTVVHNPGHIAHNVVVVFATSFKLRQGTTQVGNVGGNTNQRDILPLSILYGKFVGKKNTASIGAGNKLFNLYRLSSGKHIRIVATDGLGIVRGKDRVVGLSDDAVRLNTQDFLHRLVYEGITPLQILHINQGGTVVDDVVEQFPVFTQESVFLLTQLFILTQPSNKTVGHKHPYAQCKHQNKHQKPKTEGRPALHGLGLKPVGTFAGLFQTQCTFDHHILGFLQVMNGNRQGKHHFFVSTQITAQLSERGGRPGIGRHHIGRGQQQSNALKNGADRVGHHHTLWIVPYLFFGLLQMQQLKKEVVARIDAATGSGTAQAGQWFPGCQKHPLKKLVHALLRLKASRLQFGKHAPISIEILDPLIHILQLQPALMVQTAFASFMQGLLNFKGETIDLAHVQGIAAERITLGFDARQVDLMQELVYLFGTVYPVVQPQHPVNRCPRHSNQQQKHKYVTAVHLFTDGTLLGFKPLEQHGQMHSKEYNSLQTSQNFS